MIDKTIKIIPRKVIGSASSIKQEFNFEEIDLPFFKNEIINQYVKEAWRVYKQLPFPGKQDEPWRRTSLSELKLGILKKNASRHEYKHGSAMEGYSGEIEFTESGARIALPEALGQKGVIFTDFRTAIDLYPKIVTDILGKIVLAQDGKFAALTSAFSEDGILLYVPKNIQVELPFHALITNDLSNTAAFSHILVWVDEGAEASLFLEYSNVGNNNNSQSFHGSIVEVLVGKNAKLKLFELQSLGDNVWSITHERAKVSGDGQLDWVYGAFGSKLTKNFSDIDLVGQGALAKMSGLYVCDDQQHMDHDTQQNHLAPDTTSDLLFKGIVNEKGRSVWQGMIFVAPEAMKTDGYQTNKNLLLSKDAQANSIPGLEILANDVRCSHGSTISNINRDELFYLETRGIDQIEAEGLIVKGFLNEIIERIPSDVVRNRFESEVDKKLGI